MKKIVLGAALLASVCAAQAENPKIYIAFQWHMHQPLYTPGETVLETHNSGSLSYDLLEVFTSRTGAYTSMCLRTPAKDSPTGKATGTSWQPRKPTSATRASTW